MTTKPNKFSRLINIPIVGQFVQIANLYSVKGNPEYLNKAAPFAFWWDRIIRRATGLFLFSIAFFFLAQIFRPNFCFDTPLFNLNLRVFPILLGFGLGMFSLMLSLPRSFREKVDELRTEKGYGSEIIASDLGYPLAIIALSTLFSSGFYIFDFSSSTGNFLSLFMFFYGTLVIFDLIAFLFLTCLLVVIS